MMTLERIVRLCDGQWATARDNHAVLINKDTVEFVRHSELQELAPLVGYSSVLFENMANQLKCEHNGIPDPKQSFEQWLRDGLSESPQPQNKYQRTIKPTLPCNTSSTPLIIDVYDVIDAYEVTSPELSHAIKKLLALGIRGHKSAEQDLQDIIDSVERAKQRLAAS